MKRASIFLSLLIICASCQSQEDGFQLEKKLPKELKEISGLARDGNFFWAISDNNKQPICKLDLEGNVIQTVRLTDIALDDVEAVAADAQYIYIGDVGDNNGTRTDRRIIRILKSSIGNGKDVEAKGEIIQFTSPDEGVVKKKKSNNYDCEAITRFGDNIYLFTKRREDDKTEMYSLPIQPGTYTAKSMGTFKTKGLVTDAAISPQKKELALIGYDEGHTRPFVYIFSGFTGDNFFTGNQKRYELGNNKKLDWQVESVSYKDEGTLVFACEKTKEVDNTIYAIKKSALLPSKKGD